MYHMTESLDHVVKKIIKLQSSDRPITLLAACPNSDAVLEAGVKTAVENRMPMLFAATLNQVDLDGGYTGWTPAAFVKRMEDLAEEYLCDMPLYPCLDHGGPWLKDAHTRDRLTLQETMDALKASLTACLSAGYRLLHIDPTVDRTLPAGKQIDISVVVRRTIELIAYAEAERTRLGLERVSYEVGTEEVHGGLADQRNFRRFLSELHAGLQAAGLSQIWPCFIVGKVGTDLHTTFFDPEVAAALRKQVVPYGSLIKGHYTDWVANPEAYPLAGMGGANVGPEFTQAELDALRDLEKREKELLRTRKRRASRFSSVLEQAVQDSNRWQKWLTSEESTVARLSDLAPERREWMVGSCARYVWTDPRVMEVRSRLYDNVRDAVSDPHGYVVEHITQCMRKYVGAFNLRNSVDLLASVRN